MMGSRAPALGGFCALVLIVTACSSESNGTVEPSPDGGDGSGAAASGGGTATGGSGGQGGSSNGGTSSGGAGGTASGGGKGSGGTPGAGGAVANCTPGCKADCPQGCFDLGDCDTANGSAFTVTGSVYTAGILASGLAADSEPELYYRPSGARFWFKGQAPKLLRDSRHAGAIFYLSPGTEYVARLETSTGPSCASFTTEPEAPAIDVAEELWVDANAAGGGDGSSTAPFRTIQAAVNAASGAADVRVRAGVYREAVTITAANAVASYLRLRGEAGAILDGASTTAVTWRDDGGGVYSAPWSGDPRYLSRDGARLYHYVTRAGLDGGRGFNDVPIAEGFFVEGGRLYLRATTNPAGHVFQIPVLNTAIQVSSAAGVWIEGFEVRYYGEGDYAKGIDVTEQSSHIVVRNNFIHDIPSAVWIRKGSSGVRIEDNEIAQSTVYSWPWSAVKATDHENDAVTLGGGRGAIVARNRIHDVFNGVTAGSFDDDENPELAEGVDVFHNRLARIGDDGFEPEGACVNARFWENTVDAVHNGVSLAPITFGPVYVLKNRFTDFEESSFKLSNDTSGPVLLFHNTCYTDRPDHNGMNVSGNFTKVGFRNNVIRGTAYAIELTFAVTGNDLDYDALYTTRGAPRVKWNNVRYDDLAALCTATTLECHGVGGEPALVAPEDGRFAPATGSPLIDRAQRFYGINDTYAGEGPDIGYVEAGASETPRL